MSQDSHVARRGAAVLRAEHLSKSYGKVRALDGLSFEVAAGELFGLIGPDGAGKSTLFEILASLRRPDAGRAEVLGLDSVRDFRAIRRRIGYMPGKFSLYPDLTVAENLDFFATIFGTTVATNYHLIADIYEQIAPFAKRRAGQLSGGMKQKLALSCALIHEPELLFLDEPTTGVDAVSRAEFWDMLKRLRARGISIIVSTPYMDEAARCERIGLIQGGRLLKVDTPEGIACSYDKALYRVRAKAFYGLLQDLRRQPFSLRVAPFGEYLHLSTEPGTDADEIRYVLERQGHREVEVARIPAGIEDVFLDLM